MRAIGINEFGGPEVLEVVEIPSPEPGEGQVRIRVHSACVNPADVMFRKGLLAARLEAFSAPYIAGMDAAGVIDAVGPGVDGRLAVGDRVACVPLPTVTGGSYADQILVPAASAVKIPDALDFAPASTLLMNALTARIAIDALGLAAGDTVAVTGAAGALGGYVVQLAVADGLTVIADASPKDEELVRSLGASVVVARGDGFVDAVRAAYPDGVNGLVDGANLTDSVVGAIADNGGFTTVKAWAGPVDRGIELHSVLVARSAEDTAAMEQLVAQAESGALTLRVADVVPAAQAPEAHRRMEAGGLRGRIVLDFS